MTFTVLDPKDPDASVFYEWDFSRFLGSGETIASYTFPDFPAALTNVGDSETAGVVRMQIAGGVLDESYNLTCRITTNAGQIEDSTINLPIEST